MYAIRSYYEVDPVQTIDVAHVRMRIDELHYLGSLNPEIIVERLAGESQPDVQLSEPWGLRYDQVLKRIEEQMARLDTWQGKYFKN